MSLLMKVLFAVAVFSQLAAAYNDCNSEPDINNANRVTTTCSNGGYSFPGTFDVALLNQNIIFLDISGDENVVHANFVPFPARTGLYKLKFANFNRVPNQPRFPLNGLVGANKYQIEDLDLFRVKLVTLGAGDFSGFNQLKRLKIDDGSLTSISLSTFDNLGLRPSGNMIPNYESSLKNLEISLNLGLTNLDWSFLKPISASVEQIDLGGNGITIQGLTASRPFTLEAVKRIELRHNKLSRLPSAVSDTFKLRPAVQLGV